MSAPDITRLGQIQAQLDELAAIVEAEPQRVLDTMPDLLEELQHWPQRDAFLWCLHLATQAFRFTDDLEAAVRTAELGLNVADPTSGFAAGFHLEAGMALNQRGAQSVAEQHLRSAEAIYRQFNDDAGRAWALVALADALCGLARQDEALTLVADGEVAARACGEQRVLLRALKQRAVIQRQRGDIPDALASIEQVVAATTGHAGANALLERGHILMMTSAYAAAADDYVAANIEYAAHGDTLGLANTERALATTDLLLGRDSPGLRHLDAAVSLYRQLSNDSGLGYALRERSVVLLGRDSSAAQRDAAEAVQAFEAGGDLLGLSSAWRAVARVAAIDNDIDRIATALTNAERAAQDSNNLLAVAGIRLMQAEIGEAANREQAAVEALRLYDQLDIPIGSAHAAAFAARAATLTSPNSATQHLHTAARRLRQARSRVGDPASRADHDLSLRSIPATIVEVAASIGTPAARNLSADALLDSYPLGLRAINAGKGFSDTLAHAARRVQQLEHAGDTGALRAALRRLAVDVATLPAPSSDAEHYVRVADLRAAAPDAAILLVGAPLPSGQVPVAATLPRGDITLHLPTLDAAAVDAIDALGRLADGESSDVLWSPEARTWQHVLADVFLPRELREFARNTAGRKSAGEVLLVVHPTLAHLPFEALHVEPDRPFGVAAAVRRLPLLRPSAHRVHIKQVTSFFDPALLWPREQAVVGTGVSSAVTWLAGLGPHTLGVFAAHGNAGAGFDGWLTTTDRSHIVTAADLLLNSLDSSVVVFEACWSGRHVGHRSGETLNVTTAAL
jgi:tetratricopeptide (TPR) repeat protein